ncbi:hypothetical protein DFQ03_2871 [Maribacter caenipelagi]|uniref:DoxX-like protein n=1 Tax=Maribacter caenipelagi TaxID=1447781 RepID=A0A4R7CZY8_9FLAO|nr:hypothetical protein [Maribacter caenipelagi]TDS13577.1 hypothetical protein DFQ03_2871 [Maribacter caenipelagi]
MTKANKIITGILGLSMFTFGVLKFINPFKYWYSTQIIKSELPFPTLSYWSGQMGEILIGLSLFFVLFFDSKTSKKNFKRIFTLSNLSIVIIMVIAFYVHLHPNVPSEVLPLKISPPYIPGIFLFLAILNLYLKKGGNFY